MHKFTLDELATYTGIDGRPAYVAYNGRVYDASASFLWHNGRHQVRHFAGRDLTRELDQAPHGPELLERLPLVGTLLSNRDESPTPSSEA